MSKERDLIDAAVCIAKEAILEGTSKRQFETINMMLPQGVDTVKLHIVRQMGRRGEGRPIIGKMTGVKLLEELSKMKDSMQVRKLIGYIIWAYDAMQQLSKNRDVLRGINTLDALVNAKVRER